jgi:uncharacterized membrane protein
MPYLILKSLHILSVVLFLGNIITGLFWKRHADRTGDAKLMAHALDGVIRSDRWFTMPGVFAIIITGVGLAQLAGYPIFGTGWIWKSIVLFGISGALFGIWVAPLQKRLRAMAEAGAASGAFDVALYRRLSLRWEVVGILATITPLGALFLMVAKSQ